MIWIFSSILLSVELLLVKTLDFQSHVLTGSSASTPLHEDSIQEWTLTDSLWVGLNLENREFFNVV